MEQQLENILIYSLAALLSIIVVIIYLRKKRRESKIVDEKIRQAKDAGMSQPLLGVMDIVIARNAFGRQVDSFEVDLKIPALINSSGENPPYHAVFIRAPLIESIGPNVESLAKLENSKIVAARQGNLLATSFHPELTRDSRFHQYFLEMAK